MNSNLIPMRNPNALTGSQFAKNNMNTERFIREDNILNELINGNIPDFMRNFSAITITENGNTITYMVTPDYISLGSDNDYLRIPINAITAQKIADKFDCSLPTKKMVDDIWKYSINKLEPISHGPPYDASMYSTARYVWHNDCINKQMINKNNNYLTGGHKKDLILSNKLSPNNPEKKVCIYGWHQSNGKPIQGKNYWSHEVNYHDYSQTARFIANDVIVNGNPYRLQDIFTNNNLCYLVSDEGIVTFLRY